METAIRFSSAAGDDQKFLYVNVTEKIFKLCNITGESNGLVQYDTISTQTKVPTFRAFDWSPANESLVVVGQSSGEATLLRVENGSQDFISFRVRHERLCQSVALSCENLLAAGLDKVRTDFCLNIWDIQQRLSSATSRGFGAPKVNSDPLYKLASSESITSLKFFRDDPRLLMAGVKQQFVRLYDLREPSNSNGLQFATRCVHNIAIDGQDENYIASCSPTNDPEICVWDRRMASRLNSSYVVISNTGQTENRQPEVSLELKRAIDNPGHIWSLRFSKTKRGCLGVLSSTGHLKVYDIGKDFLRDTGNGEQDTKYSDELEEKAPQEVFLERTLDIERAYFHRSMGREEKSRIVSFDFTMSQSSYNLPNIIALTGDDNVKIVAPLPSPEPVGFSALGFLCKGRREFSSSFSANNSSSVDIGKAIFKIRRDAEPNNSLQKTLKSSKYEKPRLDLLRMSSFANQSWDADLGFFEPGVSLPDLLTLTSQYRLRCKAGYLFNPTTNKALTSDSPWLQAFWTWIERAARISRSGGMTQDNLDLSYLGMYSLWMEDIPYRTRSIGPSSNKVSKILDNLSKHLNLPRGKDYLTEYPANRQLCLYSAGLAWSYNELDWKVKRLVSQGKHTKAAAIAIFADERKLAYRALRQGGRGPQGQGLKMLAMAIAGAARRSKSKEKDAGNTAADATSDDETDPDGDTDWRETIGSLAEELTDPYARAILALVRTGDWTSAINEESLPLKYRVMVAVRWLSDSRLTTYISQATKAAVAAGNIEGIILTGTGTNDGVELLRNYIRRFGDLQTAVLGLAVGGATLRFVDDAALLRRYECWRAAYRHAIDRWGLKFDRVRFDIGVQKLASVVAGADSVSNSGGGVVGAGAKILQLELPKPQVGLVCGFCAGALGQFDGNRRDGTGLASSAAGGGTAAGGVDSPHHSNNNNHNNHHHKTHLQPEKAAALGTVCPKCGRHLPRCGVCDLWLGVPDASFLRKTGGQHRSDSTSSSAAMTSGGGGGGPVDMMASIRSSGSGATITGLSASSPSVTLGTSHVGGSGGGSGGKSFLSPGSGAAVAAAHALDPRSTGGSSRAMRKEPSLAPNTMVPIPTATTDTTELLRRFTVFCVKCAHGFHAGHARDWFGGYGGRPGHRVCPVSSCGVHVAFRKGSDIKCHTVS